jgi:hypothetical protein
MPEVYGRTRIGCIVRSDVNFESGVENSLRWFGRVLKREVLFWVGFKEAILKEDLGSGLGEGEILKLADQVIVDCLGRLVLTLKSQFRYIEKNADDFFEEVYTNHNFVYSYFSELGSILASYDF